MSDHTHSSKNYGKAFGLGIALNIIYVAVEAYFGFSIGSSALLADAGHNTSDVLSLLLAWGATWAAEKRPSAKYTYRLRKSTVMASLVNGILILGAAGLIAWDAIQKLQHPTDVPGTTLMIVAGIGVFVNTGTALLFMKGRDKDLNIKGAFLHMAADAGVTLGVVIGGLLINLTGLQWIDPVLSFLIVAVIAYSAWGLLSDSVNLALDAVPEDIELDRVKEFLERIDGVKEVHDLHVWAMSTTETALTAHLVISGNYEDQFLYDIRKALHKEFEITHTTIQIEKGFGDSTYRPYQS